MPPPAPPRFSATSADRLHAVLGQADAAVDAGTPPDAAIAKAAQDHRLPAGHVPLAVRAFNTGRAVRQLSAPGGPWEKAAAHPVASVPGVLAVLTAAPPAETALTKAAALADYLTPPAAPAAAPRVKAAAADPPTPPPPPKADAARPGRWVEPPPRPSGLVRGASAFGRLADTVAPLAPAAYKAVKAACLRAEPAAAAAAFAALEAGDARLARLAVKAAAAAPDPTVGLGHPAVAAVRDLAHAKTLVAAPPAQTPPPGFRKAAVGVAGAVLFEKLAVCPILGLPLPGPKPAAPPVKAAGLTLGAGPTPDRPAPPVKAAGFGFGPVMRGVGGPIVSNVMAKPLAHVAQIHSERAQSPAGLSGAVGSLRTNLDRIDEQAAVQELLTDPRFAKADPKAVISTYRQLGSMAPSAMKNPAVAGDFIQRVLQTGPPSYFDLKALTDIEYNLARIRKANTGAPDGDEE